MRRRRSRKPGSYEPQVSLTPLIDTALTLLIIFMLTTPVMYQSIKIDLPATKSVQEAQDTKYVVVSIKDGQLWVGQQEASMDNLEATIQQEMQKANANVVVIRGDGESCSYGTVMQIVDQVKLMEHVEYVSLAVRKT